ncbi:MAG: bacteriohemerythrin [Smithellaceae bacterium]|jgi:hemerythrin-like metal-binding protein|nr:hemerythrin family protein [Syntrophaceae bacterium]MDX9817020.1 bacteriohemerythrin [Smithellaceae bacterium]NMD04817.1 hemerythrin family protein [Deltaproteobacteria bacterium]MBP8609190.1 hemerythrin family protein [Syntrophaceae bacterium]HOU05472.1 bacteriohemerythrin [Smithellaceae bacterium]
MEKFERIYWNPRYTVYDDVIDRQHQKLFATTNKLIDKYESDSEECYDVLSDLVEYLSEHFKTEQVVMMKLRFWAYEKHIKDHQRFIDKIEDFIKKYQNGQVCLTTEILTFLRDWIFSHTTKEDLKFGELLKISRRV